MNAPFYRGLWDNRKVRKTYRLLPIIMLLLPGTLIIFAEGSAPAHSCMSCSEAVGRF